MSVHRRFRPVRALVWLYSEYCETRLIAGIPHPPVLSLWTQGSVVAVMWGIHMWVRDGNPMPAFIFTTGVILCALGDRRAQDLYADGLAMGHLVVTSQVLEGRVGGPVGGQVTDITPAQTWDVAGPIDGDKF